MENLHIENKNNIENENKGVKKQTKIAFSGKVLPKTLQEFEELFANVSKEDGTKLQFEDKLLMMIDATNEKFAEDRLQLEEKVKKSVEFDLTEEKDELNQVLDSLHVLINGFERKAKKQLATFKNTISNEAILKAQKENQNTINLLEDFRFENAKKEEQLNKITSELEVKKEALLTVEEQLRDTALEHVNTKSLLEEAKKKNEKLTTELETVKSELSSVAEKFNIQLQKNDTLRDEKETLAKSLSSVDEEYNNKIGILNNEIEELKNKISDLQAANIELNNSKAQLEANLNTAKNESDDLKEKLNNALAEISNKDNNINELKTDVKVSNKEIEMLKANLGEIKEAKNKLELENKELNNSIKDLELEHKILIDNNREALSKIQELKKEKESLQDMLNNKKNLEEK